MFSKISIQNNEYHVFNLKGIYLGLKLICKFVENELVIVVIPFHPAISEQGKYKIKSASNSLLSKQARVAALQEGLSNPQKENIVNFNADLLRETCPRQFNQLIQNQILMTNRILRGYSSTPNPYRDQFDFENYRQEWEKTATIKIYKK
eukprot:NODE_95_length_21511_cov_0.501168.p18 type:complete len:149 gc:universal NODE_95_length_21511_cov_0.501168:12662-13108(+)